jgi:hypothetical protein
MQRLPLLALALVGCAADQPSGVLAAPTDPNFTLYLSNQSFSISPVAIEVRVDGELVVSDSFDVGSQHTWTPFEIALAPGVSHDIEATSGSVDRPLVESVTVADDHDFGVINFWTDADALPYLDYTFFDDAPAFE